MQIEPYVLNARDGYPLAVTSYRPVSPRYRLLINSATGIQQRYYQHFARHAAQRGAWVFSYDYRGIAASRSASWRGAAPTMFDWGALDQASVIDHLPDDLPLALLGHSLGGQLPGLADNAGRIQALLAVAAQSGYWRLWPAEHQPRLALNWYLVIPLAARLLNRLPGRLLGGEPLPRGVALEWARWCRNPDFICDAKGRTLRPHFADLRAAARFLYFTDDQAFAPERAVRELASFYTQARLDIQVLDPRAWQLDSLGHFGFFRRTTPTALWDHQLAWIEGGVGPPALRMAA